MEKLLQLLNEFYPVDQWKKEYYIENSMVYVRDYDDDDIFNYEIFTLNIISKKFWFIQWLVENNKVNRIKEVINDIEYYGHWQIENVDCYSQYDSLLMLLAIQDDPIEFLVPLLK